MTLFGSRGTSAANSSSSSSAKLSSPRLARSREYSNLGSCINFHRKPRRTSSSQGEHVLHQSLLSQQHPTVLHSDTNAVLNKTLFERKRFQARFLVFSSQDKRTKSEPRRRRHHDSPPKQQEFVLLPIASFANPAVQTELLSSTSVCRQLHHRRLLLLEFLLQMTILPPVSDDSNAKIPETCLILCLATTRSLH